MARNKAWLGVGLAAVIVAGCGNLPRVSWPWASMPEPAPQPVDELTFASGAIAPIAQYWQGNTLILDFTAVPSEGQVIATPTHARGWPLRMAVRTWPGRFGVLEVRGAQRALLPLTTEGSNSVDVAIPPEAFVAGTRRLELRWGASIVPPVVFPQAPLPAPAAASAAPGQSAPMP